jgi:CarD family transcriptional regulator
MRKLSSRDKIQTAMNALKTRPRARRAVMWSRRAQEYEAKINSGDPVSIAEVVRELHRGEDADQSYSERQMYRAALERLAREVAAIERIDEEIATAKLQQVLAAA